MVERDARWHADRAKRLARQSMALSGLSICLAVASVVLKALGH